MERKFNKPNIVLSKCLNIDNCRFNWDVVKDDFITKLWKYVNYLPVCPEVAIWLGVPRMPIRLIKWNKIYQPWTNIDYTDKLNNFSEKYLSSLNKLDWFILKNRSPTCWIKDVKVYDKIDSNFISNTHWTWLFTYNILNKFKNYPLEDEWRLKNYKLREEFLTKIFILADFREIQENKSISDLQQFQANNKYLFMYFSPQKQVNLWRIIASYDKKNLEEIFEKYFQELIKLLSTQTNQWKFINSIQHIFWYFKNISKWEKDFFIQSIEVYKEWRIPSISLINMLKLFAIREDNKYILSQNILYPFPIELLELSDSWKILEL